MTRRWECAHSAARDREIKNNTHTARGQLTNPAAKRRRWPTHKSPSRRPSRDIVVIRSSAEQRMEILYVYSFVQQVQGLDVKKDSRKCSRKKIECEKYRWSQYRRKRLCYTKISPWYYARILLIKVIYVHANLVRCLCRRCLFWFVVGFGRIVCPPQQFRHVHNMSELFRVFFSFRKRVGFFCYWHIRTTPSIITSTLGSNSTLMPCTIIWRVLTSQCCLWYRAPIDWDVECAEVTKSRKNIHNFYLNAQSIDIYEHDSPIDSSNWILAGIHFCSVNVVDCDWYICDFVRSRIIISPSHATLRTDACQASTPSALISRQESDTIIAYIYVRSTYRMYRCRNAR